MKNRESRPRRSKRPARRATHGPLPDWKAAERELWFRGHRLRQPGRKKAPLEEALFAALQRARWDDSVPNPYSGDGVNSDGDVLTEVVRRVNDSLELDWLSFHVKAGKLWWKDRVADETAQDRPPKKRPIRPVDA